MAIACKICIMTKGLRGSDIGSLPQTEEELFEHIEAEHHMPVQRQGETPEQAQERFLQKYPEAADCPDCRARRAPWIKRASP